MVQIFYAPPSHEWEQDRTNAIARERAEIRRETMPPAEEKYLVRKAFAGMFRARSIADRTARLDQAMSVCEFKTHANGDDVTWSVMVTDFSVGNGDAFGYFV